MINRHFLRLAWLGLLGLILTSIFSVFATSLAVPVSGVDNITRPITANDLKPPECAALDLSNIIAGESGTAGNDLILGTANDDTLTGGDGDDCILGGSGNDNLAGGNDNDILLGGNGDDILTGGPGTDECYGESGTDTLDASCEIQVQ
jgi:Ca2+-binding RTX toxin-like protein